MTEKNNLSQTNQFADYAMANLLALSKRFHYSDNCYGFISPIVRDQEAYNTTWAIACRPFLNNKHAKLYDIKDTDGEILRSCLIVDSQCPGFDFLNRYEKARTKNETTPEVRLVQDLRLAYDDKIFTNISSNDYVDSFVLRAFALNAYEQKQKEEDLQRSQFIISAQQSQKL